MILLGLLAKLLLQILLYMLLFVSQSAEQVQVKLLVRQKTNPTILSLDHMKNRCIICPWKGKELHFYQRKHQQQKKRLWGIKPKFDIADGLQTGMTCNVLNKSGTLSMNT